MDELLNKIVKMSITEDNKIEEFSKEGIVDFANEYIGGGVLQGGCV